MRIAIVVDGEHMPGYMADLMASLRKQVAATFTCLTSPAADKSLRPQEHPNALFSVLCFLEKLIALVAGRRWIASADVSAAALCDAREEWLAAEGATASARAADECNPPMPYDVVVNFSAMANAELARSTLTPVLSSSLGAPTRWLGFWETCRRASSMEFSVSMCTGPSQAEETIVWGHLQTHLLFLQNRQLLAAHVGHYLGQALAAIGSGNTVRKTSSGATGRRVNSQAPSASQVCKYLAALYGRILKKAWLRLLGKRYRWMVCASYGDWQQPALSGSILLENAPGRFSADPFVFSRGGEAVCFVEEFNYGTGKGTIVCHALHAGRFKKLGTALEEDFHLSFPFVFEFDGTLYMCPETSSQRDIRIYKCLGFPLRWVLEKVLINDIAAVDSVMFEKDGRWWLLTCVNPLGQGSEFSELHAFFAGSPLDSTWTPHARNPLLVDQVTARNGGFFREGQRMFRVNQLQAYDIYGAGAQVNEILALDETTYAETPLKDLAVADIPGQVGMHHYSKHGAVSAYDVSFYH